MVLEPIQLQSSQVFPKLTEGLTKWKLKFQQQNVTPVSIEPVTSPILIWCFPLWATETYTT